MIKIKNISVRHGALSLLEDSSATLFPGHKVGLVGANGSGKSTLFSVLLGQLAVDQGDVELPMQWSIAHMAQEIKQLDQSAIDFVLDGDPVFRAAEHALEATQSSDADQTIEQAHAIAQAHEAFEAAGGYDAKARGARLLAGLGFGADEMSSPIASFSGGWRIRLSLARALMCPSDLLLLDEPTNHLDLETVTWLEGWLKHYAGTLVVISHDRDFLDAVVDSIFHIEHKKLNAYKGNYSQFEKQRAERLVQQQAAFVKQQQTILHMQQFIDRFRAKASKAKAAQSRLKALSRLETLAPAHLDSPFDFCFEKAPRVANPLVHAEQITLGYGDHQVLSQVSLSIAPGDRIGLLGLNGAGKSTLIKAIAQTLAPLHGRLNHAKGLTVGYFAQHQLEQLHLDQSAIWHVARLDESLGMEATEQAIRDFLGGFDFSGERAKASIGQYSGGEKARLVLALLVRQRPNLLLLDEPTNHLDLDMRHALTVALQSFEGAVLVVSHDRHLLTNTVDQYWWVHGGKVMPFDGDLDDYRQLIKGKTLATEQPAPSPHSKKEQRQARADHRSQIRPLQNKLKRLTQTMDELTAALALLDGQLADPELYHDAKRADEVSDLMRERQEKKLSLEKAELEWMEAAEALEALAPELS